MSIIRLSMLGDGLYAPDDRGTIDNRDFRMSRGRDRRETGKMPLYPKSNGPTAIAPGFYNFTSHDDDDVLDRRLT